MFTGIVETTGKVIALKKEDENLHIKIASEFTHELKIDQSIAHNGVCLTVINIDNLNYSVTAILETLQKTNLSSLKVGSIINLERCIPLGNRIDGHLVQGHVDTTAKLIENLNQSGSFQLSFEMPIKYRNLIVEKGSICINGVSLTLIYVKESVFSVAIIPYTWQHTNLSQLQVGDDVNIEYDILAKYVERILRK